MNMISTWYQPKPMKFLNPAWNVSCFGASRVWCLGVWKVDRCGTAEKHLCCHEGRSASRLSRLCRRTTLVCIATFFTSNVASFNPTPASGVGKPLTSKMELKFWGLLLSWFNWFHFQLIFETMILLTPVGSVSLLVFSPICWVSPPSAWDTPGRSLQAWLHR